MKTKSPLWTRFACAAALAALTFASAADEAEIFVGTGNAVSNTRPNILFIMDTSGSMTGTITTQVPFDPATTYPTGSTAENQCRTDRVYFERNGATSDPPSCKDSDNNWVPLAAFKCKAALDAMALAGYYVANPAAQWRSNKWQSINGGTSASTWVECKDDEGRHGNGVDTNKLWAADGGNGPWSSNSGQKITWTQNNANRSYVFFSGNYVNWLRNASTITQTRLQIIQQVATSTIDQLAAQGTVNMGLMRFSNNTNDNCDQAAAEGGMVLREVGPVETQAALMKADIAALTADGCTPLSETMFEAYRYLSGNAVRYGINSRRTPGTGGALPSVLSSRQAAPNTGTYKSPLTISCERNFIVLLTDGLPTSDGSANADIQTLIGGNCAYPTSESATEGRCLEEIARYMYENDIRPTLAASQNVTTYTVGFALTGTDGAAAVSKLRATAAGAGGTFYEAKDTASLTTALTNIVRTILDFNTSFTAPAVSVNAFNRTQNLDQIFVTVFNPSETYAWQGNVKKYRVSGTTGAIIDANSNPAVNVATGFFRPTSQSLWSVGVDGDDVSLGGAAALLPGAAQRKLYTDLNTSIALTAAGNAVETANTAITLARLGLGATEQPGRDALINWMRGQDVADADGDGITTDARLQMGDPMNGRPATVIYGGTVATPNPNDGVVFAVTNEGYLHAIDAQAGTELWAFVPSQLLARASDLFNNEAVNNRVYGLDANILVVKNEVNSNGVIESSAGERVILYFGMRRGGSDYFAIDVTDRNAPTLLWRIGPNEAGTKRLPGAGQSWSTPTLARVNISGATQNTLKQVLVFGGGYDTVQDNGGYAVDAAGNQIFMVDAISGDLLWRAGPSTDTTAQFRHAAMTHAIPGDVRIFDLSGDGFADRMYAATMGGRIWRFDITNGQTSANLVTGGVFASLGNAHLTSHPVDTTRRFYSAPSVAFLSSGGRSWLNIAIGSGYRGHPLNIQAHDRFYALRDHQPFARLTQAQYDAATVITEADVNLIDITTDITPDIPPGASGWRLDLRRPAGTTWTGEKSLSEATTVASMIQFTTYEPSSDSTVTSTSCAPSVGTNRLYTVSAMTGAPVYDRESPIDPDDPEHEDPDDPEDRDEELHQAGIAPEVVHLFLPQTVCLVGLEVCEPLPDRVPIRTFWRQTGVN